MSLVSVGGVLRLIKLKQFPLQVVRLSDSVRLLDGVTTTARWLLVFFFLFVLEIECKGFDEYPDTARGDSINMCAGEGTRQVFCDYSGKWIRTEGVCYCPAENGWESIAENMNQERSCGSHKEYRYCGTSGVWGEIDSSECSCPTIDNFLETAYGAINENNRCDNGVTVTRMCSNDGVWGTISYSGLCRCTQEPGWQDGLVGDVLSHECSYGRVEVNCNEVGHWITVQNDCACAADGVWEQSALGETHEKICGNQGRLRRTCGSNGFWEDVQDFNCECPRDGIWDATPAGEYARAGCSTGFIYRLCGADGQWTEEYDRSGCYCSPQAGWQLTLNGELASKACPYGEQVRACDEWGRWGEIDYSNCMCKPQDGFEATPVNSYATASCFDIDGVPDTEHTQTRFCDANGNWGDVDQTQCPVKWCPTVESWYAVPVGNRPTRVTLGCMSGERWRQCNVNGQWGPVNTDNCDCTYSLQDDIVNLLRPGESYSLSCAIGERVYKCNENSGYFDPVDLSTCKCASDGRFTSTNAGELASAGCSVGTSFRLCNFDGQWEETDNSRCFCGESGVWRQANYNTTVSVLCDIGFRMRVCNDEGYWDEPIQDTCMCRSQELEAPLGSAAIIRCDEGAITYDCNEGTFASPDSSTCYCGSRNEFGMIWNRIPAGGDSPALVCMNGYSQTRHCGDLTGQWEDLNAEECRCLADGIWAETGVGEYAFAPCEGHSTGLRRRMCQGSHWGDIDDSTCLKECEFDAGNGEITYVPVDSTLEIPCYVNFDGSETYKCMYNSETNESYMMFVASTCTRLFCETDLSPFIVHAGDSEERSCIEGFTGTRTRTCQQNGTWTEYNTTECAPILCPEMTYQGFKFPVTLANTYGDAECAAGYHGARKLFCNIKGEWGEEVIEECEINVCPQEGEWPATEAFKSHTLACPADYTGEWTRQCLENGEWEELVIPDTCIPRSPTLKSIPYEGMKHVSRAPSVALFSSLAIKEPYDACSVSIVSIENAEETYTLTVNATKTSLQGRYRNGGVFADFPLPADADIHDLSNYLKYGEYKAVFPACWKALNGATVPASQFEVTFHTTAIPPSAPTHITIQYAAETFSVAFEEPTYVDEPYPVTAYYLSFQPPVYPEVRIDGTKRVFGPFKYFSGRVNLLLRAENAYGLSSPDVLVPYNFEEVLIDAASQLQFQLAAPEITHLYSVAEESAVAITVGVHVPPAIQQFASYLDVFCNNEQIPGFTTIYDTTYTFSTVDEITSVSCFFRLAGSSSEVATSTINVVRSTTEYAAPEVTAEESSIHILHLTWNKPAAYTAAAIAAYIVECKPENTIEYPISFAVTGMEAFISVTSITNGPVVCRVGASSTAEASEATAWGMATVSELHVVSPADLSLEVHQHGSMCDVQVLTPYCVDGVATLTSGEKSVTMNLVCNEEKNKMIATFTQLAPETVYSVAVTLPSIDGSMTMEMTTQKDTNSVTASVKSEYATASSAVVHFSSEAPIQVYCIAHSGIFKEELLTTEYVKSVAKNGYSPAEPSKDFDYVFMDLGADTSYKFTCVTPFGKIISPAVSFTTLAEGTTIRVVNVVADETTSRNPSFLLEMNSRVYIPQADFLSISCGGLDLPVENVDYSLIDEHVLRVSPKLQLIAGSVCYMRFISLDSIVDIHYMTGTEMGMLSATPFPGDLAYYKFTVTVDGMSPRIKSLTTPEMGETKVLLFTVSETIYSTVTPFQYSIDCVRRGESTVHRTYTTPMTLKEKDLARKGYIDVYFYTGLLPHLHTCTVSFENTLEDAYGNAVICNEVEGKCSYQFVSRAVNPDTMSINLVSMTPANNAVNVAVNTPVMFVFDRDVEAVKAISFRCLECETTQFTLEAQCEGMTCTVVHPNSWEASRTYAIHLDGSAFKAAWEEYYVENMSGYSSFTTAASMCNMEYITEDWDSNCSCINTGTHCQCNCGDTAILKRF